MKIRKLLCMILVLALSVAVIYSCGADEPDAAGPGGSADDGDTTIAPDDGDYDPEADGRRLPFEPVEMDLGGRPFNFAVSDWGAEVTSAQRCVVAEEMNGEVINDAVFMRNSVIEAMFNTEITESRYPYASDMHTAIRRSVSAGDDQFQAAYIRFGGLPALSMGGYLHDIKRLPNIDISQPWWDQNIIEQVSIANRLFVINGDIQILDKGALNVFIFNKQLLADYQLPNLYELVETGRWTLDAMLETARQVSEDLNGDGIMDENDRFGLFYYRDSIPAFLNGAGAFIAQKDENDLPVMTFNTERTFSVLDAIYEVIYDETIAFHTMRAFGDAGFIIEGNRMFQNNQGLLKYVRMVEIEGLRGMETDFGILPFPKYNEFQENYLSLVNASIGAGLVVPITSDPEIAGALLDAKAFESRYTLIPAYIDITLMGRITRDDDSEAMLDIIFGNMTYDIGGVFDLGGIVGELMFHTMDLGRGMATFYERREAIIERDLNRLIEAILDLP